MMMAQELFVSCPILVYYFSNKAYLYSNYLGVRVGFWMYNAVAISFYWDDVKTFAKSHAVDLFNQFEDYETKSDLKSEVFALATMHFTWLHPIWSNTEHMKYEEYCTFLVKLEKTIEMLQVQPTKESVISSSTSAASTSAASKTPTVSSEAESQPTPSTRQLVNRPTPTKSPRTPAKPPRTPSELPQTPAELPQTPAELPQTSAEKPQTPAKPPRTRRKTPTKQTTKSTSAKNKAKKVPGKKTVTPKKTKALVETPVKNAAADTQLFIKVIENRLTTVRLEEKEQFDNSTKSMETIFFQLKGKTQPFQDSIGFILRKGLTELQERVIQNNSELLTLRAFCSGLDYGLTNSDNEVSFTT